MSTSPPSRGPSVEDLIAGVQQREIAKLARALTLIESNSPRHQADAQQLLTGLMSHPSEALRIGITGPPGAGKSTFIEALGMLLIEAGYHVAVLAVDPSSGISGGSILGDKTRMGRLAASDHAFIRPSPSAGTLGGVAHKTRECMVVVEAAGYDIVLVETVGVGQSETMVAGMTDCFIALMLPGSGDELQGIKRGLLELVDIIAVNKADGDNVHAANLAARQLRSAMDSISGRSNTAEVLTCSAKTKSKIDVVWQAIQTHCSELKQSGRFEQRRRQQNLNWLWSIVDERLRRLLHTNPRVQSVCEQVEQQVLQGELPPSAGATRLLESLGL